MGYGQYEPSRRMQLTSPSKKVVWVVYKYVNEFGFAVGSHEVYQEIEPSKFISDHGDAVKVMDGNNPEYVPDQFWGEGGKK